MGTTQLLLPQHRALIDGSRICAEVCEVRGYRSVAVQAELKRLGFGEAQARVPALLIPILNVHGDVALYQIRPDAPRIVHGKSVKYETPRGARMVLDVPPGAREHLSDPGVPLFITEGVRKADSAVSRGLCCVDLLGVWNFRGSNEYGGKTALPDWEMVALNGRRVYLVFDSDVMEKRSVHLALGRLKALLESRGSQVSAIYLPSAADGGKVGLDDFFATGGGIGELLRQAEAELRSMPGASESQQSYEETPNGLVYHRPVQGDTVPVPLTNFTARIVADTLEDDGLETRRIFEIEAVLHGQSSSTALVASRFAAMNWVTELLGPRAVIYPGLTTRDHARAAIQLLSDQIESRTVCTHTGWRRIHEKWVFLHAGDCGPIGPDGPETLLEVRLDGPLAMMALPSPPDAECLVECLRRALELLDLGRDELMMPLFAAIWRAPLGEALPTDFTLHLAEQTGVFKSELAALAQGFFGRRYDGRNLPGTFRSTANSNEQLLAAAKDLLVVIDDFAPCGTSHDIARFHRDADSLLRGVGNRAGRGRLRPDGTQRPAYRPRGLTVTTGEDVPQGHSLRARMLVLEVAPGDVAPERLLERQRDRDAGCYAKIMAAYVRWLAPRIEELRAVLPQRRLELRERFVGAHRRVPDIAASLFLGFETFVQFAREKAGFSLALADEATSRAEAALAGAAAAQGALHESEDVVARFLDLLRGALTSGLGHIVDVETGGPPEHALALGWSRADGGASWSPRGTTVGWIHPHEGVYLEPEAGYSAVQRLARDQGTALGVTPRVLWRRLCESGVLASRDDRRGRNLVRRTLHGARRNVVHMRAEVIAGISPEIGPSGPLDPLDSKPFPENEMEAPPGWRAPVPTDSSADVSGPDWHVRVEDVGLKDHVDPRSAHKTATQVLAGEHPGPVGPVGPEMEEILV